jgi:hypothetical protein
MCRNIAKQGNDCIGCASGITTTLGLDVTSCSTISNHNTFLSGCVPWVIRDPFQKSTIAWFSFHSWRERHFPSCKSLLGKRLGKPEQFRAVGKSEQLVNQSKVNLRSSFPLHAVRHNSQGSQEKAWSWWRPFGLRAVTQGEGELGPKLSNSEITNRAINLAKSFWGEGHEGVWSNEPKEHERQARSNGWSWP